MRTECIFCNSPLDGSDEHIIPESLNGRLHTTVLICSVCNNKFGTKLDPVLKEKLYFILHVLNIGNAEKLIIEDENGKTYTADRTGKIKEMKVDVGTYEKDGQKGIRVSGEKESALKAFAKKAIRTYGSQETMDFVSKGKFRYIEKSVVPKELKAKNSLEVTSKVILALDKIITEFFVFSGQDPELIRSRLDKIYNLDESDPKVVICNFDHLVRIPEKNEVSHIIIIKSDSDSQQVYGYIELFNVLCGYTVLVEHYEGPEINHTYYQNAITSEVLTKNVSIAKENAISGVLDFEILVGSLLKRKRDIDIIAAVSKMANKVKEELDKKLSSGEINEKQHSRQYMEATAQWVGQMMVDFPDDFEDVNTEKEKINYIHSVIVKAHREEFEVFYHQMIGREFYFEEEKRNYKMTGFHFVTAPPKDGIERLKVYCLFKSTDKIKEQHVPVFDVFSGIGLQPPPDDVPWL